MKRLALLTAIAMGVPLAAAAPALADPAVRVIVRDDLPKTYQRDRDVNWNRERYDRWEGSRWQRDRGRWEPLARGYDSRTERQFIKPGNNGRFRKLRIEGVRGEPVIMKIAIEFADKTGQVVEYRESLPAGTGEVIDLNGGDRRISRIIVYTDPRSRGSYSVYGA